MDNRQSAGFDSLLSAMAIMPDIQNSPTMEKNQYFKSLDYHSREEAKARLAEFLMKQEGWTVFGYSEDKSDSMSDYSCPADWDGVATFGEYVLCVGVRSAHEGHEIKKEIPVTEPCEHCLETGEEPNGWTLEQARQDPKGYNAYKDKRDGQGVTLFNDVVSPLHFKDGGAEKCRKCHGTGEKFLRRETQTTGKFYPAHQANPERKGWHLEKVGVGIVTSGQSIAKLYRGYWSGVMSEQREAVQKAQEEFLTELRIAMELEQRQEARFPSSVTTGDLTLEIVDYSERSFAVFGDTKAVWPKLEAAGGKFNRFLTHPKTGEKTPGVIFGMKRRANVEQLIQSL